jgi:hypothetical protein
MSVWMKKQQNKNARLSARVDDETSRATSNFGGPSQNLNIKVGSLN